MKKHFWKIEYSIILLIMAGFIMLFIPVHIENYIQANMIKIWKDRYSKTAYMFNAINAQANDEILQGLDNTNSQERESLLIELVEPYMRLEKIDKIPWRYKPKYMNGSKISKKDNLYFKEFYLSKKQRVVGIKDIQDEENKALFSMMFDINGFLPPNVWGKDIFGVYIYDKGEIKPFGYDETLETIQEDCSKKGLGITCSHYYLIGGEFND